MGNTQFWPTKTTLRIRDLDKKSPLTSYDKPINIQVRQQIWQPKTLKKVSWIPFKNMAKLFVMPL